MRWWMMILMTGLVGCGASQPMPEAGLPTLTSPLVGPEWTLVLIGTDERWQGANPAYFALSPGDERLPLAGSDGCNRLTGSVTLGDSQRIDISLSAATRMACPGSPQSAPVDALLSRAYRYLIDHDRLVLFGRDRRVLGAFKRQ